MSRNIVVFDTTLRDGEQSPGASMNLAEKLEIARALRDLGVDVIEAGFPIASPGDFEAVKAIAGEIRGPVIAGLARCDSGDIDRAWDALKDNARPRLHVFLATSAIHRQYKLRMARKEILRRIREGVGLAKSYCADVEFSPEDASRTEHDFLREVVECAIDAGATTVNIPDTVGYAMPTPFSETIAAVKRQVGDRAVISVHCHNDLGMAVANSLAAVTAGAGQVECTVNGIGERAGNASLEEIVMAIRTRKDQFPFTTNITTERLYPTSRLVSKITGLAVQRNKAIVGENAFAHEAGIHQHGILQHQSTYEIMRPQDVGFAKSNLVLGKHSGRHAFRNRIEEMGYHLNDTQLNEVFEEFKALCDKKKEVYDSDIEALAEGRLRDEPAPWQFVALQVQSGTDTVPTATITLRSAEREVSEAATGDGPVDACFRAIERITGTRVRLRDFQVRSVSVGKDAQGEVHVEVEHADRVHHGRGVSTDIIEAGARAFLSVVNRFAPVPSEART